LVRYCEPQLVPISIGYIKTKHTPDTTILRPLVPSCSSAGLILLTGISSLTIALAALKPYAHLQLVPHLTKHRQVSRRSSMPICGYVQIAI
jgi:hypothetical protein